MKKERRSAFLLFLVLGGPTFLITLVLMLQDFSVEKKIGSESEHTVVTQEASTSSAATLKEKILSFPRLPQISTQLSVFREINRKILTTTAEKAALKEQLSDENMIRRAFLLLGEAIHSQEQLTENEQLRLMALDYFEQGLKWAENPSRLQVAEALKNLLMLDNLSMIEDLTIRKSFAGDKVEIYAMLKEHEPSSIEIISTLPTDGRIRKLIKYAEASTKSSDG